MTDSHIRNVIEAALLAAGKPLQAAALVDLFDEGGERPTLAVVQAALAALAEEYSTRGIEIKETAAGFRIQVRADFSNEVSRLWPERPAKYSRALLETLAIIAYRQPITRAEIEAVRGVPVNPNIVKTVVERNWVHVVGHRDVPGRPELLATTRDFLDYFGLKRLDELPPLAEVKALGEIKVQFDLPDPGPLALVSDSAANESTAAGAPGSSSDAANTGDTAAAGNAAHAGDVAAAGNTADAEASNNANATGSGDADATANSTGEAAAATDVDTAATAEAANTDAANANADVANPDANANGEPAAVTVAADASEDGAQATHESTAPNEPVADSGEATEETAKKPSRSAGRSSGGKKKRGKARSSDNALHEAEEFAASVDADLAAGDDDSSDDDELSAAGPDSSELVAGPRDIDD